MMIFSQDWQLYGERTNCATLTVSFAILHLSCKMNSPFRPLFQNGRSANCSRKHAAARGAENRIASQIGI